MFQKKTGSEKVFWIKTVGEYRNFPSKIFLSQKAGKFRWGTLQSFVIFGYRKTIPFRGLCHDFLSKKFSFHRAEKGRRGTIQSFNIFGYRKKICLGEFCHIFLSNNSCLTVPETFVGEPSSLSLFSGIQKT